MSDIQITKKKGESFEALFRRFTRRVQQSGKVFNVRAARFFEKAPTKNKLHGSKLRKLRIGEDLAYKLRVGKITEEELRGNRNRR